LTQILLLIDDEPAITEILSVALKRSFDEIYTATSGKAANELLERHPITHIVADYVLGPGEPTGAVLIAAWRQTYLTIRFAGILTGRISPSELVGLPGIDAAVAKPHSDDLIRLLQEVAD
jgi:CheY-like chemotaxis protein